MTQNRRLSMEEYLITIAADSKKRGLSTEETSQCIAAYSKWADSLAEKHVLARRLGFEDGDFLPSKRNLATDGPFAEAKELIAGVIIIQVKSLSEAREIANSCPLRDYFHLFLKKVD